MHRHQQYYYAGGRRPRMLATYLSMVLATSSLSPVFEKELYLFFFALRRGGDGSGLSAAAPILVTPTIVALLLCRERLLLSPL